VRRRVIALKTARAERVADALERSLGRVANVGGRQMARSTGRKSCSALENTSWRHKVWAWRPGRPLLASFLDGITLRPSFAATVQPEPSC